MNRALEALLDITSAGWTIFYILLWYENKTWLIAHIFPTLRSINVANILRNLLELALYYVAKEGLPRNSDVISKLETVETQMEAFPIVSSLSFDIGFENFGYKWTLCQLETR